MRRPARRILLAGAEQKCRGIRRQLAQGPHRQVQPFAPVAATIKKKNLLVFRNAQFFPGHAGVTVKARRAGIRQEKNRRPGPLPLQLRRQILIHEQKLPQPFLPHQPPEPDLLEPAAGRPSRRLQKTRAMINTAHAPAQFHRGKPAEGCAPPASRRDFIPGTQEDIVRAALTQTGRDRTSLAVVVAPAVTVMGRKQGYLGQQPRQVVFNFALRRRSQVHRQGEADVRREQIFGDEPQPAEMVAFSARFIKQQMPGTTGGSGTHGDEGLGSCASRART